MKHQGEAKDRCMAAVEKRRNISTKDRNMCKIHVDAFSALALLADKLLFAGVWFGSTHSPVFHRAI